MLGTNIGKTQKRVALSLELHSGAVDLSCNGEFERLVIPGKMGNEGNFAARHHLAPACVNVQELGE
jgi:hypothetical protein